jgi:hypothetical protein
LVEVEVEVGLDVLRLVEGEVHALAFYIFKMVMVMDA